MLYDARHVFVNGESVRVRGTDAALLRRLADARTLDARAVRGAEPDRQGVARRMVRGRLAAHAHASAVVPELHR